MPRILGVELPNDKPTHIALRYMPSDSHAAFWELSSLGGGSSVPGGVQPLRGFGQGRFTDRNLSSATLEVRQRVVALPIFKTTIALQVTPCTDWLPPHTPA